MTKQVLVAYASRHNSTAQVAEAVGASLNRAGVTANVLPMIEVNDLDRYDAVVLGSPIRIGQWLPEALEFVRTHRLKLNQKPVAIFTLSLTLEDDTSENRATVKSWLEPVRVMIHPVSEGYFAGAAEPENLNVFDFLRLRIVKAPFGNFINWPAVRMWSAQMIQDLLAE